MWIWNFTWHSQDWLIPYHMIQWCTVHSKWGIDMFWIDCNVLKKFVFLESAQNLTPIAFSKETMHITLERKWDCNITTITQSSINSIEVIHWSISTLVCALNRSKMDYVKNNQNVTTMCLNVFCKSLLIIYFCKLLGLEVLANIFYYA